MYAMLAHRAPFGNGELAAMKAARAELQVRARVGGGL